MPGPFVSNNSQSWKTKNIAAITFSLRKLKEEKHLSQCWTPCWSICWWWTRRRRKRKLFRFQGILLFGNSEELLTSSLVSKILTFRCFTRQEIMHSIWREKKIFLWYILNLQKIPQCLQWSSLLPNKLILIFWILISSKKSFPYNMEKDFMSLFLMRARKTNKQSWPFFFQFPQSKTWRRKSVNSTQV